MKYQDGTERKYLHVLNGTAFSMNRPIAAILENYQQNEMSVWVLTGDHYQAAGKPEMAQQWYSRVLDKDTNNTAAEDKLKALGLERVKVVDTPACT